MSAPHMKSVEIGYGMSEIARNQGATTLAVKDLVSLAFRNGMERVTAEASPQNRASERVLEKVGFKLIGYRIDDEDGKVGKWLIESDA